MGRLSTAEPPVRERFTGGYGTALTWLVVLAVSIWSSPCRVEEGHTPLAPGYGELGYTLPAPGSYALPPLGPAADGRVLDSRGNETTLHALFGERYVLLSFMYTHCSDANGCPLTAHVFYQLKRAMGTDKMLAKNLRLVSLSFDPERDTPAVMRRYGNGFRHAGDSGEWRFATTRPDGGLEPILDAYSQNVQRALAMDGTPGTRFFHVLRVFLIDPERQIRNIYSVDFLHAGLIRRDLQTLMMAAGEAQQTPAPAAFDAPPPGPGDNRSDYASADYETRSRALQVRDGRPADLPALVREPPLGLPALDLPEGAIPSAEQIALGRKLFFDRRLSLNETISCAMCHIPEQGFSNNEMATAVGMEGRSVRRNAPTLLNIGYAPRLFHDGREDRLSQQIWGPLLAANEMANPSVGHIIDKLETLPDYHGLFQQAFAGRPPGMQTVGDALAAYQLSLNAADSPFDRWYFGEDEGAVTQAVKRGFELFTGRAGCSACHTIGRSHALFSDYRMHNTGAGLPPGGGGQPATRSVQLAPGVFVEVEQALIDAVGATKPADLGRYEITRDPADRWKFRTPTLRNVALTAPYMHDGSIGTLREVIGFYNRGGVTNPLQDSRIQPLGLTETEQEALVAFLESLTGSNVNELIADALAAPVGDPHTGHTP
jgi:cytochrome c peroxidase